MMKPDEMIQYARDVRDRKRSVKRNELEAFMDALLIGIDTQVTVEAKTEGVPITPPKRASAEIGFKVMRTQNGGIGLPRDANKFYTRAEAFGLVDAILTVLGE